ncbi:MAG TPA: L,D-transpeptidase family protein [Asanoa sp.]
MHRVQMLVRLTATAAVVLMGAGACAFAPSRERASAGAPVPVSATGETGASAPPDPTRRPATPAAKTAPKPTPTTKPTAPPAKAAVTGCPVGTKQRDVEVALAKLGGFGPVVVDGKQSAGDCRAIKKFQRRYGISPAEGRAGPTTADVAKRLAATDTRACDGGKRGTTFCVDLTHQTTWAVTNGRIVVGPTVTRTGMSGYATATGHYTITWRNLEEWSDKYEVWLPYWQHFTLGMGFHETTTYIHDRGIGSHGCVNLLPADARAYWKLGAVGTAVHIFGRRPGT